ncbi:serine hydrolase [Aquimarina sp. RZ0]|uniref:serine hydrolase domain-containing protein n=1 Tax=Aquimarina sp. RZ0 TaxID=2607730 RepID=UPI0011F26ABD|nr:serine hydrolase domain-containing protein [Aquimarina sp. RZ0]KAA1246532.1 beta-lactamase family protein [Aquimarina sp. RZ0]
MKKCLIIIAPLVLLTALLFPPISESQIEKPQIAQTIQTIIKEKPFQEDINIGDLYKERLAEAIEDYFNKALRQNKIVGASVGIVKCDSTIYLGGFGKRNTRLMDRVSEETIFRVGSVSKGFGGILAGIHVEEGLLSWDDKIVDYIPNFELRNKNRTNEITLSHVLSHSAGLPYHSYTNLVEDGVSLDEIAGSFKNIKSTRKPGTIYSYQNAAFALSGEVIERVTGKSFGEVMQEKIFTPLEMVSASTDYETLKNADNVAQPHQKRYGRWRKVPMNTKYFNAIAAGGVNASVVDMAKWMKFLLGHNPEVMKSASINDVFTPRIKVEGKSKYYQRWAGHKSSYYGLGWRIHNFVDRTTGASSKLIHHGGHVNSYRSEIALYPQEDIGITVLFNSPTKLARNVIPDIHKIIKEVMNIKEDELLSDEIAQL